jgi:hypothetical protein
MRTCGWAMGTPSTTPASLPARTLASDRTVMTTWHEDEPAGGVADFFFNVASAEDRSLLVAVLGPDDNELARLLIERASQR